MFRHRLKSKEYYDKYLKQENEDICPVCGKQNKFRNMWYGYNKHCSKSCTPKDPLVQEKMKQTSLKKYGVEHPFQAEEVKDKIKQTNLEKYGVYYSLQSEEVREKGKQTNLEKYGHENYFGSEIGKERLKQIWLEKENIEYVGQSKEVLKKINETKTKNGNKSGLELFMISLLNQYNVTYIEEYKKERYPYFCDFYLPDLDMFIEIHGHWFHGGCFF